MKDRRRSVKFIGMVTTATAGVISMSIALLPSTALAQTATPPPTASGSSSVAVVAPLLNLFQFGDTIGLPLACQLSSGLLSEVAGQANASTQVSPVATQLGNLCTTLSKEGEQYLQQAISQSEALTFVNPTLDPVIAGLASGVQTFGGNYGPSLAPIGPTIAGLGGTVAFFEGS